MKKLYKVTTDHLDPVEVTVEVDHAVLTEEMATHINKFLTGAGGRLAMAKGNVIHAVVQMAAAHYIHSMLNGYNEFGATCRLEEEEGWPPAPSPIRCVRVENLPEFDSEAFSIEEVQ
jgi:hypothetical protein